MHTATDLLRRRGQAIARGLATPLPIVAQRAEGAELWDVAGRRYVDFAAGIAVLNLGHRHPKVVQAVQSQLEAFTHTCFHVAPYENYIELAERLNAVTPGDFAKKTALFTTGAEAVENAIKMARAHTGRPAVIAFSRAFHGRTMLGMALTGKVRPYKLGFGPLPGHVFHVPCGDDATDPNWEASRDALETLFKSDVDPATVAALIIEPVQGEGGFHVVPPDMLRYLRRLCDQHGIVFVMDEIQTGFGRTGRLFACEHSGVAPDLMTMAKGLAGGMPLSAVTGRAEIVDAPAPGGLGGTYAGNPLCCAAALAVLQAMEDERIPARAMLLGERMTQALERLAAEPGLEAMANVRGLGAMVAFDLVTPQGEPAAELVGKLVQTAVHEGLILLTAGMHGNTIRLLPPLTISDALLDEGLEILGRCLRLACGAQGGAESRELAEEAK